MKIQSKAPIVAGGTERLNIYSIERDSYENPHIIETDNLYLCANQSFLQKRNSQSLKRYQAMI